MTSTLNVNSFFQSVDFPDPKEGLVFVMETANYKRGPVESLYEMHAMAERLPLWTHSRDTSNRLNCTNLKGSYFAYRLFRFTRSMNFIAPITDQEHAEFWISFSPRIQSVNRCKKANLLLFKAAQPLSFQHAGVDYAPVADRPCYLLEMATGGLDLPTPIALEPLLNAKCVLKWSQKWPSLACHFEAIRSWITDNQVSIHQELLSEPRIINAFGDNFIVLCKSLHKIEGFFVCEGKGFCLTTLNNFQLRSLCSSFDCIAEAYKDEPLLYPVFKPQIQVSLPGMALPQGVFKTEAWRPILEMIPLLQIKIASVKNTWCVDEILLTALKTVARFHKRKISLGGLCIDQIFLKMGLSTKTKIWVLSGSKDFSPSEDLASLGLIAYNLWIRFVYKKESNFITLEQCTPSIKDEIIHELAAYIAGLAGGIGGPRAKKYNRTLIRVSMIKSLFSDSVCLLEEIFKLESLLHTERYGKLLVLTP